MDEYSLVQDTYNSVAQVYTDRYGESGFLLEQTKKFTDLLSPGAEILDLGCGSGRASRIFVEKGFKTIGIDFSKEMLRLAKVRVLGGEFRFMDIRSLQFERASFDALWSCFSIIHIPQRDVYAALSEWKRVLKPEGLLFVGTSLGKDEELIRSEWLQEGKKIFFHHFSEAGLRQSLESAGFLIEEMGTKEDTPENEDLEIVYAYAKKLL